MLVAQTRTDIAKIVTYLETAAAKYGLKVNYYKTKSYLYLKTIAINMYQSMYVSLKSFQLSKASAT